MTDKPLPDPYCTRNLLDYEPGANVSREAWDAVLGTIILAVAGLVGGLVYKLAEWSHIWT